MKETEIPVPDKQYSALFGRQSMTSLLVEAVLT
jgi:hypothetical protein